MRKRILIALVVFTFIMAYTPMAASAAKDINLDGDFTDWQDKPNLSRSGNNNIDSVVEVRWHPDISSGSLYLYCEREVEPDDQRGKKFEDWDFEGYLSSELGERRVRVSYHPPSRFVDVDLLDEAGALIWSAKGKWGDNKYVEQALEFEIPLQKLVSSTSAGYQIDLHFGEGQDRFPADGGITIATISTFPIYTIVGTILVCMLAYSMVLYKKKRRLKVTMGNQI
ncbi:MAG: hypothetical protein N3B21_11800 [Clostridia bacterium]|nr:hypothetical protein [Clostridia bacterium]